MSHHSHCGVLDYEQLLVYVEQIISRKILCGELQPGLLGCNVDTILPKGTRVVRCEELAGLIQDAIDNGDLTLPGLQSFALDGTELVLVDHTGEEFRVSLEPIVQQIIRTIRLDLTDGQKLVFVRGNGEEIEVDLSPYTDEIVEAVSEAVAQNQITELVLTVDHVLKVIRGDGSSLDVDLTPLIPVATNETIDGDGTAGDPLRVNTEALCIKDVCGFEAREEGLVIVLCGQCEELVIPWDEIISRALNVQEGGGLVGDGSAGNPIRIDQTWLSEFLEQWLAEGGLATDQTLTGEGTADVPLGVQLSKSPDNLLRVREDGLFYGIVAPPDLETQFVSSVSGDDTGDGTKESPLRTVNEAFRRIAAGGGQGRYNIRLRSGETFIMGNDVPTMPSVPTQIIFMWYDEPTFGDQGQRGEWRPHTDVNFVRPVIQFDTYTASSGLVYSNFPYIPGGAGRIEFAGCDVRFLATAGLRSSGGAHFDAGTVSFAGSNLYHAGDSAICGAQSVRFYNALVDQTDALRAMVHVDSGPIFHAGNWGVPGAVVPDPLGEYPPVTVRAADPRSTLTLNQLVVGGHWDAATKTMFGFSTTWDIFA